MVSLDGQQKIVKTVPNNYIYHLEKELSPTEYKSVLPTKFVFLYNHYRFFETGLFFFIDRYQIKNEVTGEISKEKFRVYTTAVYTVLLYNTNDTEVG